MTQLIKDIADTIASDGIYLYIAGEAVGLVCGVSGCWWCWMMFG